MAKSTYVWLDQLSRDHGRDIRTLDAIPDEELDALARWGVTGPVADRPVGAVGGVGADQAHARQRRRGRVGLLARRLPDRRRPRRRGGATPTCATGPGRAASGWPATWSRTTWASTRAGSSSTRSGSCRSPSRPIPAYTFSGPDLSTDERVGIVLEDHYWDDSDAAVVFKRFDRLDRRRRATSTTATTARASRGTTPPSSTSSTRPSASRSSGRSSTSPGASRSSASTRRWSSPRSTSSGCGGPSRAPAAAIPSRAEHAHPEGGVRRAGCRSSSGARSSTASPPRCPARSSWPRRSGCSRATSSGRSGCTASTTARSCTCSATRTARATGKVIKDTLEFDPEILKRYVNFMSNPDEKTAVEQFGKGDKYFGVATVLATLPGLPMLGHGQVQGFGEKYGMEFRRAIARRAARPVARRAPRARDLPAAPPAGLVRRGGRLPAVRPS